ncbi:MAG: N-acetylneuraminate synthase family protein [bacterium]
MNNARYPVPIGDRLVGDGHPCYVIAEIGINHNGDIETCKKLIDAAKNAGCDAVKFQKRTPELCVPKAQAHKEKETPWGVMTYLEYKRRLEFGKAEYDAISDYCARLGIDWFASVWDEDAVDFIEQYQPVCYKVASASLTDDNLIKHINSKGRPIVLSTGMSNEEQIEHAKSLIDSRRLIIMHSTSAYPCPAEYLNLNVLQKMRTSYEGPVGYSGHEVGLSTTIAAVALGANSVERHITLGRSMWGTDHAASVEPQGLSRLVRDIRVVEKAMGDGKKVVYDAEMAQLEKLRRVR